MYPTSWGTGGPIIDFLGVLGVLGGSDLGLIPVVLLLACLAVQFLFLLLSVFICVYPVPMFAFHASRGP